MNRALWRLGQLQAAVRTPSTTSRLDTASPFDEPHPADSVRHQVVALLTVIADDVAPLAPRLSL